MKFDIEIIKNHPFDDPSHIPQRAWKYYQKLLFDEAGGTLSHFVLLRVLLLGNQKSKIKREEETVIFWGSNDLDMKVSKEEECNLKGRIVKWKLLRRTKRRKRAR
jgi:hypothetical protein